MEKNTTKKKQSGKSIGKAEKVCNVPGCNEPQRASGFCGPHYGRWRRGTLNGFVGYDGNIKHNDEVISVGKKLRGKEFSIKDEQIWVDGVSVATLNS